MHDGFGPQNGSIPFSACKGNCQHSNGAAIDVQNEGIWNMVITLQAYLMFHKLFLIFNSFALH